MRNDDVDDDLMDIEMGVVSMPNFRGDSPELDELVVVSSESETLAVAPVVPELPDAGDSVVSAPEPILEQSDGSVPEAIFDAVDRDADVTQDVTKESPDKPEEEMVTITMANGEVVTMPRSRLNMLMQASEQLRHPAPVPAQPEVPTPNPQVAGGPGPYVGSGGVGDGLKGLANGASRMLGGMMSVAGVAAGGVGTGANALVSHLTKKKDALPGKSALDGLGVGVMPRITDYRAQQVERAVSNYEESAAALWDRPGLADVRSAVKERALALGQPVADVVAGMRPGGAHEDLSAAFQAGVEADPLAATAKDKMEKSLSAWANQNVAATPEMAGGTDDPTRRAIKARIEAANERMEAAAAIIPPFKDEDESHLQRIQAVMARIVEAIKNFVGGLTARKSSEASHAPAA